MDDETFEFCQDGYLWVLSNEWADERHGVPQGLDVFEAWDLEDFMRDMEFMALVTEVVQHV